MIKIVTGNLLEADADAYVNTVNTVGVMGKGIALQFKRRFPDNFKAYAHACKSDSVKIGRMFVHDRGQVSRPRFIVNFPTKNHWRGGSRLSYIQDGLVDLVAQIKNFEIRVIAIPALGCSNGGLAWTDVRQLIRDALEPIKNLDVLLYAPQFDTQPVEIAKTHKAPRLTVNAALILKAFELYCAAGYVLGRTVAQKLGYFIQASGKDMKLAFDKRQFGPYSEGLTHYVESFEGHYIEGFGDRSRPSRMILKLGVVEGVNTVLEEDASADDRETVEKIAELIEGFETPYGMELLASLHWLNSQEDAGELAVAKELLAHWSQRKAHIYPDHHIEIAWQHLKELGWLNTLADPS